MMRAAEFLRALVDMLDSIEEEPAQKQPPIVVNVNNGGASAPEPAPEGEDETTTDKFVPPLQQKIELLKKHAGLQNVFNQETNDDEPLE